MKNTIPKPIPALLAMAGQAANGAGDNPALLVINTKPNIDAETAALTDAIMEYGKGKIQLSKCRDTLQTKIDDSRAFITISRDTFKPTLGNDYNVLWDETGMVGSIAVPFTSSELLLLLDSYKKFLTAHADMELPTKNVTAARAAELLTQLNTAQNAMHAQLTTVENLFNDRDAKAETLRERMSDVIAELKIRLDGLDARWEAFGLNKPDALETPDAVEHVQAALIGPTAVALKWDSTDRAEYYHVFKRVQGVDQDYVLVGSPADLDFTLENLPTNAQIDIVVSAVNNGGEGQRSQAVTVTTHA